MVGKSPVAKLVEALRMEDEIFESFSFYPAIIYRMSVMQGSEDT